MADLFETIAVDHREVQRVLDALTASRAETEERRTLAEKLVIEESKHEAVEEQLFWPTVRERVGAGVGDALADAAIEQEDHGKELLDQLRVADFGSRDFERFLDLFAEAARHHILYEEQEVWPAIRPNLSAEESDQLSQQYLAAKEKAPTRPHPHTPSTPRAQKVGGAAAATIDKARDAATGRG